MKTFEQQNENLNFHLEKKNIRVITSDLFGDEIKAFKPRDRDGSRLTEQHPRCLEGHGSPLSYKWVGFAFKKCRPSPSGG